MKVLLINQIPEVNNKYTFSLAKGIKASGVDVKVCGIKTDDVSAYDEIEFVPLFDSYSTLGGILKKLTSYIGSWKKVCKYCTDNKIDIVHVQWYIFSPADYYFHNVLRKNGIKIVTTIHDLLPFNKKFYDFTFHKKIYRSADAVINQARCNRDVLVNKFGVKGSKISYIPHGHYMEFAESVTREDSRKYLGICDDSPVVLFFGQIKKVKGVDVLIDAMKIVTERRPEVKCIIAGKVWKDDFSLYMSRINELNLKDVIRTDIKFIPDEEIKYYFNAADVVALPYRRIYQSGCVLLAAAYEKPVVATTEGEFLSVVKDKETGLLVGSGDSDALAEAIIWYIDNPDKAEEFGKELKKDLNVRLDWRTIGRQVNDVYYSIL